MTETYNNTPVIRLPKSKSSSIRPAAQPFYPLSMYEPDSSLVTETLYFDQLPDGIANEDIRSLLGSCQPIEIHIGPKRGEGFLRFSSSKLADRAFSLYNGFTFLDGKKLQFRLYHDGAFEPKPEAPILQVKQLPAQMNSDGLYDLFRPFGPLALCKPIVEGDGFRGTAFIQYFYQEDSDKAQRQWHDQTLHGHTIYIQPFSPRGPMEPTNKTSFSPPSSVSDKTDNTFVDYMNLYVKNLDPALTNADLFNLFRNFGRIVSARVMSNPATGQSKGYGFVSFSKPEEAQAALREMNNKMVISKPLIVAFHEPKKPRQDRQVTASSPTYPAFATLRPSPPSTTTSNNATSTFGSPDYGITNHGAPYYPQDMNMPLGMNNNNPMTTEPMDQLAMQMHLKELGIGQHHAPPPPSAPQRKLSSGDPAAFQSSYPRIIPTYSSPMSTSMWTTSAPSLAALASGLTVQPPPANGHTSERPSEYKNNVNGRPTLRRKNSLESVSSVMTATSASLQRQKMTAAVQRCGDYGNHLSDIVDMLLTLKRMERSLCLFNRDFLMEKIELALEALEAFSEDSDNEEEVQLHKSPPRSPLKTNKPAEIPTSPKQQEQLSPLPTVSAVTTPTISAPAAVPAASFLTPENEEAVAAIIASLEGKLVHEQKQLLGDHLFPLVKSTGVKQAPKITIRLLDTIDLKELARLMFDKAALKDRVDVASWELK
ncbi:uncharacterized protein BYT42DRAFT_324616 [Radiomyces spectabilis]|uniref:uncharacterized protein n=1 Tax=Radiomyces spectabilis TaxID=64574 RepID=UPI0022207762|nr:uncharacterized protein BYT42DRAFT_324616 [Radiomyces spectabilis]KAI8379385.1 hypothetical protein BYT42DRAFT_324616 [Radiomyces spectabilis]